MGIKGCYIVSKNKVHFIPTVYKNTFDTTGCGDIFFSDTDFIAWMGIINRAMELSLYSTPSKTGNKNFRALFFL